MNRVVPSFGKMVWADTEPDSPQFNRDGMSATLTVDLAEYGTQAEFAAGVLGYTTRPVAGGISRRTPARHPLYTWCRAVSIDSMRGQAIDHGNTPNSRLGILTNSTLLVPAYKHTRCTILFTSLPYEVYEDNVLPTGVSAGVPYKEFYRYVLKQYRPSGKFLTRQDGHFGFAGTNVQFQQGISFIVRNMTLQWTWLGLLDEHIFNAAGVPTRIMSLLGTINAAEFAGYAAGTLLLESADIQPRMLPVEPEVLYGAGFENRVPRCWDVTYNVLYFEPVTGKGHNYAPYPGSSTDWRLITANGALNGDTLYQTADWNNLLFTPL